MSSIRHGQPSTDSPSYSADLSARCQIARRCAWRPRRSPSSRRRSTKRASAGWDGVDFSTAYFDRRPDGLFSQPQGRWSDWLFPLGSFCHEPGMLDGTLLPAMSVTGMLAMKEQLPNLRNGRPWRQKDIDDIETL